MRQQRGPADKTECLIGSYSRVGWAEVSRRDDCSSENDTQTQVIELVRSVARVRRVNFMVKLLRACVWMPWRK